MRRSLYWLLVLLGLWPATAAFADVRLDVRTDRTRISLDDTLTLQISIESQGMGSPRVEMPAFDGFQVVSQQVQRPMQFSFSFGAQAVVQSSTIYTFGLQPLREGTLVIKPVKAEFEGHVKTSRPIEIIVSKGGGQGRRAAPSAPSDDDDEEQDDSAPPDRGSNPSGRGEVDPVAFVRTVADKAEPYEGEQVTVTIYLYVRERLQSPPEIATEPTTDGLWTQDLMTPNQPLRPERQVVGNVPYAVYVLRRFAAFPLRSGELTVGPMAIEIDTTSLFDMFGGGRQRPNLKRASAPLTLKVKPLPAEGRPPGDIAVGRYKVSARLDRTQVVAGDALTLTAVVEGQGNIRTAQLKPPSVAGVEILQPDIKDLIESPRDVVSGRREYRFLVLARNGGHIDLPALTLNTFDPRTGHYETRASEPLSFEVVGQAHGVPDVRTATPEREETDRADAVGKSGWAPVRTQSALLRSEPRLAERAWYGFAVAAPMLLWIATLGGGLVRRRLALRGQNASVRARRAAESRVHEAEKAAAAGDATRFYSQASAAVIGALEARLGEAVAGLTRQKLRALLAERGMEPQLIEGVVKTLEDCEFARFGSTPLTSGSLSGQAEALGGFVKRLLDWTPAGASQGASV